MTALADDGQSTHAPWMDWPSLSAKINHLWDPTNTPHHSIVGLTGSGKSYLMVNGILKPMCPWDRVLIVDTKGDDETISSVGYPVTKIPDKRWSSRKDRKPGDQWWRLVVSDDHKTAVSQVSKALDTVYSEGNWVVVFDEIRDITDPPGRTHSGLGLLPRVDLMYRKGRYKKVSIIAATQAPRWVPPSFYDQASFAWIGRIRDELRQKRLLEIGGMSKSELPILASLERRQWFVSADSGEFMARSKVTI